MADVFRLERATFLRRRAALLRRHHGEFVLIRGRTLHGLFATESEALAAGYRRVGHHRPFYVRRIERPEEEFVADIGIVSYL